MELLRPRTVLLLIALAGLAMLPLPGASALVFSSECLKCQSACTRVTQDCLMANYPCGGACSEACQAQGNECRQTNCIATGICPTI